LTGEEEVVKAVSLFNIEAVKLVPDNFFYDYKQLIKPPVTEADKDKPTNLLTLQYPF